MMEDSTDRHEKKMNHHFDQKTPERKSPHNMHKK